jgi:YesN/AraC family two-component response regulator
MYTIPIFQNVAPFDEWVFNAADLPIDFITRINNEHTLDRLLDLFDKLFRIHISNTTLRRQEERKVFVDILDLFLFSVYNKDINYSNKVRVEHIIKHMTMHFSENLSIADLAEREKISVSYLVRIFKEITNQTPITYLNNIRMNKAKQLLADGCSVTETSENVGFSDVYYFSRAFKKYVGITPSKYKDVLKEV